MGDKGSFINVNLTLGDRKYPTFFKTKGEYLHLTSESIISATLLPSMKLAEPIIQPARADYKFLSSLSQLQEIFSTWDHSFSKVRVNVQPTNKNNLSAKGVGTFFTGGVDSFYTFLKHRDEVTHLVYVHGYENHKVSKEIQKIGQKFNKEVIEIETNLRVFSDPIVRWHNYIGAALATIGHLLKTKLSKIYIPSSHSYLDLEPNGSHPLTDPLWSSSDLTIVHDGCEATRIDKLALIAQYQIALDSLRVCWKSMEGLENCGKCEKCIRTMINLKAINALEKCPTFPNHIPLRKVAGIMAEKEGIKALVRENLVHLKNGKNNKLLIWALWWVLHKPLLIILLHRNIANFRNRVKERLIQ